MEQEGVNKPLYIQAARPQPMLHRFASLLSSLVARDFKGQYRRSVLGPAWAIIQPLFYMVIFVFLRKMLRISSEGVSDALDTYAVLVPWSFLSNAIMRSGPSIYSNGNILKKIAMPREVFPAASVALSLIDLGIAAVVLIGMMVWYRAAVGLALLWLLPLVGLTVLLAMGAGFLVAALGAFKRDIVFGMPFLIQFWLLATPILYPLDKVPPGVKGIYVLNPAVGLIEGFRSVLIHNSQPDLNLLGISLAGVCVLWLLAWPVFRYTSQYFADVL